MTTPSPTTVFITGATAGFGAAIARRFARDGARLIISGRREDRLDALTRELGGAVHTLVLDVRDRRAVLAAVDDLPGEFREIDVLVNNAGLALGLDRAHEANLDDWDTMVDTNVKGLMYCTRAVLPGMVARDRGHVINIGSVAATWPYVGGNAYGATKAFVMQFSFSLRSDLLGTKVRVTDVAPGLSESEFSIVRFKGDVEKAKRVYEGLQPIVPEDVAETVWWVASRPPHVNINRVEMMPVCQAVGGLALHRE